MRKTILPIVLLLQMTSFLYGQNGNPIPKVDYSDPELNYLAIRAFIEKNGEYIKKREFVAKGVADLEKAIVPGVSTKDKNEALALIKSGKDSKQFLDEQIVDVPNPMEIQGWSREDLLKLATSTNVKAAAAFDELVWLRHVAKAPKSTDSQMNKAQHALADFMPKTAGITREAFYQFMATIEQVHIETEFNANRINARKKQNLPAEGTPSSSRKMRE